MVIESARQIFWAAPRDPVADIALELGVPREAALDMCAEQIADRRAFARELRAEGPTSTRGPR